MRISLMNIFKLHTTSIHGTQPVSGHLEESLKKETFIRTPFDRTYYYKSYCK